MGGSEERKAIKATGYTILFGSLLVFIHSAMGVSQYKQWASLHDEKSAFLPLDIYLECFVGLGIALFAINFFIAGPFKEIVNTSEAELKRMDGLTYCEDFAIFNLRRHPVSLNEQY